jgi:protein SCO1/2
MPESKTSSGNTERPPLLRGVGIDQRLNGQVPLDLLFQDEEGRSVRLGDYFGKKPVVLSLVYFSCPMLCTTAENGLLESLKDLNFDAGKEFEVLTVSFDPADKPSVANAKKSLYVGLCGRRSTENGWHFLTGNETSIRRLTDAVGFHYNHDPETRQFAHGTGIVVLTPEGKISRYLYDIHYPSGDLRLALVESSNNEIGSPVDQLLLFCCQYDPALGRDPILFQHLFWFYSHPAVYIMIHPSMGVVSELVTCFSRKRIFGYSFIAFSSVAIAAISFLVWGFHMFVSGQSVYGGLVFSALSFAVGIPSAIKVLSWTATLYKGSVSYQAPMLYASASSACSRWAG